MKIIIYSIVFLISLNSLPAQDGQKNGKIEEFVIPFVETQLSKTGVLDEEIWEKAAQTSSFSLYKTGETPKRSTHVQLFYDAQNLYIRFICAHPANEPLKTIINQEMIDARVFSDDCVEVFLTQEPEASLFHLASSARGVRYDDVDGQPDHWNGRWQATVNQRENHWEATFTIPFDDLSLKGAPAGTPKPGTRWWVNFAREESRFSELSQWSVSERGFAERARFRPVTFGERPNERLATISRLGVPEHLFTGNNKALLDVKQNINEPLLVTVKLERLDRENAEPEIVYRHRIEEAQEETFSLEVPFEIQEAGNFRLLAQVESARKGNIESIYSTVFDVVDIHKKGELFESLLQEAEQKLDTIKDTDFKTKAEKDLKALRLQLEKLKQELAATLTAESGRELAQTADLGRQAGISLLLLVQKKQWQESLTSQYPNAIFSIGVSSPFEQIFSEDLFSGAINQKIQLQLARNESEAAQVVIIPLTEHDLKDVKVEVTPLKKEGSETLIEASQWSVGEVGYIETPHQMFDANGVQHRFWPDVCLPSRPFDVQAGSQRPVYLRLHVPADQPAGRYHGELKVHVGEMTQNLPIEVEVWDFTLPETPTLRCDAWMRFAPLKKYYGVEEVTLEQYERILRDFRPYRLSIYPFGHGELTRKIKLFREKDGSLSADFTEFDPYIDLAIRYGANAININLATSGMLTAFAGGFGIPYLTITDRETGVTSPYPAKCRWPAEDLLEAPDFIAFWKLYWKHAKEKGWDKVAYVEDVDEPNDNSRKEELLRRHKFFREHCPDLSLQSFGPTPSSFSKAIGLIDIWSPVLNTYDRDSTALQERRKAGDKLWLYTCGNRISNAKGEYIPDTFVDYPLISKRIPALMGWKYGAEGLFHFSFNSFAVHPDLMAKGKEGRWGEYPTLHAPQVESGFGISNLTWPGPEKCQLLPSLRLEMIREGREDYEYLVLLERLVKELAAKDESLHAELIKESKAMLSIPDRIVANTYQWCRDPQELMEWRAMIARQILQLTSALQQ